MLELKVAGMTCEGCASAVTAAVGRAVPGAEVRVDVPAGLVRVDGVDRRELVAGAIEDAGFTVVA